MAKKAPKVRPPRMRKTKATAKRSETVSKKRETVHHKDREEVVEINVPPGDARVSVGHDRKYWSSDRTRGMTVGTSCHITLSCEQSLEAMEKANEEASQLAFKFMTEDAVRVDRQLKHFIEKVMDEEN